jgi:lysophospholipase L1-like esterase
MPVASTPTKPKKSGLKSFGKFVLWVVAICLVLEVGLRLFGFGSYVIYRPDERLLWVPMPGTHKVTEMNHEAETISPQNFRYRQVLSLDHPGIYRVFAFGDSTTMGWGVDDDSNYSSQLEKLLNDKGCSGLKFQVISAGVNAYPNALVEERAMKVIQDGYQPDAEIISYSANTGFEGIPDLQGHEREVFLKKVELKSIARRSALYNFLIEDLLRGVAYYRFREVLMLGTWNSARSAPDLPAEHFLVRLEKAKAVADAHHVQQIYLLVGSRGETYPAHPYQAAMLEYGHANNVPVVDIIRLMKNQNLTDMFLDHVHPTPAGHTLIAEELFNTLTGTESYQSACRMASNGNALTSLTDKPAEAAPASVAK